MDSKERALCASFPVLILKYHGGCVGTESRASAAGGCFLGGSFQENMAGKVRSEQESSRQPRGKVRKSVPGERERSTHCERLRSLGLLLPEPQGFPHFCALKERGVAGGGRPGATATGAGCGVVLVPVKAKLSIPCDREDTGLSLWFGLEPI